MKKIKILCFALLVISQLSFSQKKKIAVVTFYANKMVSFDDLGGGLDFLLRDVLSLRDNPNFNLNPIFSQLIAVIVYALVMYLLLRFFIFPD